MTLISPFTSPLISVVIPVYNGSETIQATIESVLNQSFTDFELLVIDDGSQDHTVEIVQQIQDPRIQIFSYPNAGLSASRNRGIVRSTGEYISFVDADDLWTADKLELQLKALYDHPQAALAYSWTSYIDAAGQITHGGLRKRYTGNVYADLLQVNFLQNGSNALFRKSAFAQWGNFDETLFSAEDWDLYLRFAQFAEFVLVPAPQILYRRVGSSMSSNVRKLEKYSLQVLNKAFDQAPPSLQTLKRFSLANVYKYLAFKALEGSLSRQRGLDASQFLWKALKYNPQLLLQWQILIKMLFRITASLVFNPQLAQVVVSTANPTFRSFA